MKEVNVLPSIVEKSGIQGIWATGSYSVQYDEQGEIDPVKTQQVMHDRCGGWLIARGGGEYRYSTPADERAGKPGEQDWVVPSCNADYHALGLPPLKDGSGKRYRDFFGPRLWNVTIRIVSVMRKIRRGGLLELPYADWADEDFGYFQQVEDKSGQSRKVFKMRGFAGPRAHKLFMGLPFGCTKQYVDRIKRDLDKLLKKHPDTIIQWEVPPELFYASLPIVGPLLARRMMRVFEELVASTPAGTMHAFHLCNGNLGLKPFIPKWLQNPMARMRIINAILGFKRWTFNGGEQVLVALHDPHGDDDHPIRWTWRNHRAFKKLRKLPESVIYVYGVLRPDSTAAGVIDYIDRCRRVFGARVTNFGIAATCGDGRKVDDEVAEQYKTAVEVCEHYQNAA